MSLKINLPFSQWEYKISCVYEIKFDDGSFYIGCSNHVRSRASAWESMFNNHDSKASFAVGKKMIDKIKNGIEATLNIVELCSDKDLKDRESFYLDKFKDDTNMLSSIHGAWKPVLKYTKEGQFVKKYYSLGGAARDNGTELKSIQRVLSGERKSHKDMIFIYEHDYDKRRSEIIKSRYTKGQRKNGRNIIMIGEGGETLKVFRKMVDAGREIGVMPGTIKRVLSGMQKTSKGFRFEYQPRS